MVAASPSEIRQPDDLPCGWVGTGALRTFDVEKHKDAMEHEPATSCVSQIKLEAQRPPDSTTGHRNIFLTFCEITFRTHCATEDN